MNDMKKIIRTLNAPAPVGPYSQAIAAGNILFVAGQIALDPVSGKLVNHDISSETRRVMENLKAIVQEAGLDMDNVVKCTIFLHDLNNFTAVNEVYGEYFPHEPPARETVQVSRLPVDAHVEISCIAIAGER
jgi:2-iminobutanoate/2-iminopropanoate deaminase